MAFAIVYFNESFVMFYCFCFMCAALIELRVLFFYVIRIWNFGAGLEGHKASIKAVTPSLRSELVCQESMRSSG